MENFEKYFNEEFDELEEAVNPASLPDDKRAYAENLAKTVADSIVKDVRAGKEVDIKAKKAMYKNIARNNGGWVYGNDVASYFIQVLNDLLTKSGIVNKINRTKKREVTYQDIDNLSPEEYKEAADYLQNHVISIKFGIPSANSEDAIRNRLEDKYTDKPAEWIDDKAEKLLAVFNNYKAEFEELFPDAIEGRDFYFRKAENKEDKDPHIDLWHMMAETRFDEDIEKAPASIIKMMLKAQSVSKNEAKSIEEVKKSNVFNSYYFALAVLKMFDNDLSFYQKRRKNQPLSVEEIANSDDVFKQDFDSINAYGEKVESLREAKEEICCICGEPIEGYGNNPEPYKHEGRCCDACNNHWVIPARLAALANNKDDE